MQKKHGGARERSNMKCSMDKIFLTNLHCKNEVPMNLKKVLSTKMKFN